MPGLFAPSAGLRRRGLNKQSTADSLSHRLAQGQFALSHHATKMQDGGSQYSLTQQEVANSRFYGISGARADQMTALQKDVDAKGNPSGMRVGDQIVDVLNKKIDITLGTINLIGKHGLNGFRSSVLTAIAGGRRKADPETAAWANWLSEPSRISALMMPELNLEEFKREYRLDKAMDDKVSELEQTSTDSPEALNERIDEAKGRIYVGDANLEDSTSHYINSGIKRKIGDKEYDVYWTQESVVSDMTASHHKNNLAFQYTFGKKHRWTPEMDAALEDIILNGKNETNKENFEKAVMKKYGLFSSKRKERESIAKKYYREVEDHFTNWGSVTIMNRFFRLTSLMGLDFFTSRGNNINFIREHGQKNFARYGDRANRVITDSEWSHANQMGYVGKSVRQVSAKDRFRMS